MTASVDDYVLTYCAKCAYHHHPPGFRVAPGLTVAHISEEPCKEHHWEWWSVTHEGSGLALFFTCCQRHAEVLAELVSGLTDWTLTALVLREREDELREELRQVGIRSGDRHHCEEHFWSDNPRESIYPLPDWLGEREGES